MPPSARSRASGQIEWLSVSETDANRTGSVHDLSMRVHGLQLANGVRNTDRLNMGLVQANHLTEPSLSDQIDRGYTETSGQDAVERGRRTAALDVSQDADPHVFLRAGGNGIADPIAD